MSEALTPEQIARYKAIYGPPSVLSTESIENYELLFDAVMAAVQPRNIFEFILMRHFVGAEWTIYRYVRHATVVIERKYIEYRRNMVITAKDSGVNKDLKTRLVAGAVQNGVQNFLRLRDQIDGAALTVKEVLGQPAREMDHNIVLEDAIEVQDRLNSMVARQTVIRNDCLRQLELHRAGLGKELEKVSKEVIDAEFSEVRSQPTPIEAPPIAPQQIESQNDDAPASSSQ